MATSVFAATREISASDYYQSEWPLPLNQKNQYDGLDLLSEIGTSSLSLCIFDPQYRGILDKMRYGNEGVTRGRRRAQLLQMSEATIRQFIDRIADALIPSGHLFLWVDKFHLCTGVREWTEPNGLEIVDLVTWNKKRMGMGYRTRRQAEYLVIAQKLPKRAKGVWQRHNIPDVWDEKPEGKHTHSKPINLQAALIEAVTNPRDVVLDPAAGSYSVLTAASKVGRQFLGCDIEANSHS